MNISGLQLLLFAGAIQGVFLVILLCSRKVNQIANLLLALLILLVSVQSILVGFDNREFFMRFPHLSRVSWLLPTLFGPLIFMFTQKLTSEKAQLYWKDALNLIPFVIYFILLSPYFLLSTETKRQYLANFELASIDDFGLLNQLTNVIHLSYAFSALVLIRKHEKNILDLFSEISKIRLKWLKEFVSFVFLIILFGVFVFYARKWNIPILTDLYHYHYLGVIILIYWIGYKALSQPAIFQAHPDNVPEKMAVPDIQYEPELQVQENESKYLKSGLQADTSENKLQELLKYMKESKPYLRNELTLQELAEELNVPRHHLSQIINDRLNQNFYTFINEFRVNEAKSLLLDPRFHHDSILAIALESGFNSKATFNAVFKKQSGMTPTEFINKHKL
jgi:AraC-like DNA-binding protein